MIIAKITSGLGNQLFQYAFARNLADIHGTALYFDLSFYKSDYARETNRTFKLDQFDIRFRELEKSWLLYPLKATKLLPGGNCRPLVTRVKETQYHYNRQVLEAKARCIITQGYWTSEKYFSGITGIVRRELTFKHARGAGFEKYRSEITGTPNSVSVHIRRGDYVNHPEFSQTFGFIGTEYYQRAVKRLKKRLGNPRFFVFTDDPTWVRENFSPGGDFVVVENTGSHADLDDLHLISLCRHNIIANSTFSWWGAWLNENEEKQVIAPRNWFRNQPDKNTQDVIPAAWTKL